MYPQIKIIQKNQNALNNIPQKNLFVYRKNKTNNELTQNKNSALIYH